MQPNNQQALDQDILFYYRERLANDGIEPNPNQAALVEKLAQLQQQVLLWHKIGKQSFLRSLFGSSLEAPTGIYIHGGVGVGKTMLMDLFYETLNTRAKQRVHFHAFMQEIHARLHRLKEDEETESVIHRIAKDIAEAGYVLCFDEFQVYDITDAMILARLFAALFNEGIVVVATSNVAPEDLYRDGLQRERFLPFIETLRNYVSVVALESGCDYRLRHVKHLKTTYYTPLGKEAARFIKESFYELTQNAPAEPRTLQVHGRALVIPNTAHDVGWVSFEQLCGQAYGSADYIEIAREFNTLIMDNIPLLTAELRNETKRFIVLVDELYERRVTFICSAATAPGALCSQDNTHAFEFERTASRLIEMQSNYFIGLAHKG